MQEVTEPPRPEAFKSDDELIGYCETHCETPRALFHKDQVARMLWLAGNPCTLYHLTDGGDWVSLHETMAVLCIRARERMKAGQNAGNTVDDVHVAERGADKSSQD